MRDTDVKVLPWGRVYNHLSSCRTIRAGHSCIRGFLVRLVYVTQHSCICGFLVRLVYVTQHSCMLVPILSSMCIGVLGLLLIRYFWQENHKIYGHIRCIYTALANPVHMKRKLYRQWKTTSNRRRSHNLNSFKVVCWSFYIGRSGPGQSC
jgi:hypothetical protein